MLGLTSRLAIFTTLAACTGSGESPNPDGAAIDELIAGIGALPSAAPHRMEGTPNAPVLDGDYRCVTSPIDETRQYDQLLGQIGVGDVLWSGDLLRGDSIAS